MGEVFTEGEFRYQPSEGEWGMVGLGLSPILCEGQRGLMVTNVSPPDQATGVSRSTNVTVTLNVSMAPSSLTNPRSQKSTTFILMGPGRKGPTQVSAKVTCNNPCTTAALTPSKSLAANTIYTATVKSAVEDTSGKKLGSDYIWSFRTGG